MSERQPKSAPDAGPFAEERSSLRSLVGLLAREHAALLEADPDEIQAIASEKLALVQKLDHLRQARQSGGLDAAGRRAIAQLVELTAEAQRLNAENTYLLNAQRASCDARLNALRTSAPLDGVYGSDGRSVTRF